MPISIPNEPVGTKRKIRGLDCEKIESCTDDENIHAELWREIAGVERAIAGKPVQAVIRVIDLDCGLQVGGTLFYPEIAQAREYYAKFEKNCTN